MGEATIDLLLTGAIAVVLLIAAIYLRLPRE